MEMEMERKKLEDEKEIERKKAENYEMYLRKLSIDKKEEKRRSPILNRIM